jgi:very-short-patch-repair endonuclease
VAPVAIDTPGSAFVSTPPDRLAERVGAQGGLFTRRQARSCGYSDFQISRRVAAGEWRTVIGPVLAHAGRPTTPLVRDRAASLAAPWAVLSGPSAARRYGVEVADRRTFVTTDPARRLRLPGIVIHREPLPDDDIVFADGMLLTTRDRAIFDCLRWLPATDARDLLDRALQQRWTDLAGLAARVHRFAGRPGIRRLIPLLRDAGPGARSVAERVLHRHLRLAGLGGWSANAPIHDADGRLIGTGDIVFRAVRLVVEVDGRAWHSAGDRFRQNRLVAAGWSVLRFTWHDLTERPAHVVATIREMCRSLSR